jgi:hypothetical protein
VEGGLKGSEAALNRSWKLEQARADFLSTQMSAQATSVNAVQPQDSGDGPAETEPMTQEPLSSGNADNAGALGETAVPRISPTSLPMGKSWSSRTADSETFKLSEGITGLKDLGLADVTLDKRLSPGLTGDGATMSEVQAAARVLMNDFDKKMLPAMDAIRSEGSDHGKAALGLNPKLEKQVNILRGLADGQYSPIAADEMLRRGTGQGLQEAMARLTGTIEFVITI